MIELEIIYRIDSEVFKGYLALPDIAKQNPAPAVLIAHAWMGRDDFACEKARALAELGYIAFAADMYGQGKVVDNPEQAGALMMPLFENRSLLQKRIRAAFDVLSNRPEVDKTKIGAIGFCFGGMTVVELLRSGAPVKGVVSFHGVLADELHDHKAKTVPIAKDIQGALLVLHGYKDPLVSNDDLQKLEKEMSNANVDWQVHIYGTAKHAFTNPQAKDPKSGLYFDSKANDRSWHSMKYFLKEKLS
jgi:dienelactone hydrolase